MLYQLSYGHRFNRAFCRDVPGLSMGSSTASPVAFDPGVPVLSWVPSPGVTTRRFLCRVASPSTFVRGGGARTISPLGPPGSDLRSESRI